MYCVTDNPTLNRYPYIQRHTFKGSAFTLSFSTSSHCWITLPSTESVKCQGMVKSRPSLCQGCPLIPAGGRTNTASQLVKDTGYPQNQWTWQLAKSQGHCSAVRDLTDNVYEGTASVPLGPDIPDLGELLSPVVWLDTTYPSAELNKGRAPLILQQTIILTCMKAREDQESPCQPSEAGPEYPLSAHPILSLSTPMVFYASLVTY